VRRYHYETHRQLREHLDAFLDAYNFAKRLKTLRGLTPFENICKAWTGEPRIARLVLSTQERACLERQVRRHRVAGRYLTVAARSCGVRMACQASPWLPNSAFINTPLASGAADF
jgi:hypothetical protein